MRGSLLSFVYINLHFKYLTIIGRGWAKYRDLSVASRSIICRSRRVRQIIDLRDTDKSRYFAITEFNNCFIIRSRVCSFFCFREALQSRVMAPINWFLSQHNYICRLQIVLTVKRSITLGINKAEEFHSFQSVSRQVKLWCKARHSFFWLQHKISSVHMHSPTCPSLRYSRNTLSATFVPFLVFSLFFRSTKDVESFSNSSGNRSALFSQERDVNCAWAEYYLQQNTYLKAVICRSRGGLSANEKEGQNTSNDKYIYYMEESVLPGTKPLVDSIRHYIRDPSGVFSVCHLCECRIVQWRHDSRLFFPAFFIKPSRICKTWLLWNTIKSEFINI